MGITTLSEAARYESELAERTKRQMEAAEGTLPAQTTGRARHRDRSQSVLDKKEGDEFSFASAPSIQLLSPEEQLLCSALHILPQPFLLLKSVLLASSFVHHRELTIEHWVHLCAIDRRKLAHIYDFFRDRGYFQAVTQASAWSEAPPPPSTRASSRATTDDGVRS